MSESRWDSYIEELKRTGKIDRAVLIDHAGSVLAATPGLNLTEQEVSGILTALGQKYTHLINLNIGQEIFTCFQSFLNPDVLIGRAENYMLTIQKCNEFVVVGLADPKSPGSCIYEVTRFAKKSNHKTKRFRPCDAEEMSQQQAVYKERQPVQSTTQLKYPLEPTVEQKQPIQDTGCVPFLEEICNDTNKLSSGLRHGNAEFSELIGEFDEASS